HHLRVLHLSGRPDVLDLLLRHRLRARRSGRPGLRIEPHPQASEGAAGLNAHRRILPLLLALLALGAPRLLSAQGGLPGSPLALVHGAEREGAARYRDPPVNVEGRYVVISLDEHRLYVMEDERVIWSTLVGTGTGTRLEGA